MPKVRLLAPAAHPKDGSPLAAGAEVDVDEETFQSWRASGLASAVEDEKKAAEPGVYDARTGRSAVGETEEPEPPPRKDRK